MYPAVCTLQYLTEVLNLVPGVHTGYDTGVYMYGTWLHCTIVQSKVFISRSCPILVLMLVLVHPRGTDAKNDIEYYQGQTTFRENDVQNR